MRIAVSVDGNEKISKHLGKCKTFLIFEKENENVNFGEVRTTDGNHQNHVIEDIKDCQYVISAKIGEGMVANLEKMGIKAVEESETDDPMEAVKKI